MPACHHDSEIIDARMFICGLRLLSPPMSKRVNPNSHEGTRDFLQRHPEYRSKGWPHAEQARAAFFCAEDVFIWSRPEFQVILIDANILNQCRCSAAPKGRRWVESILSGPETAACRGWSCSRSCGSRRGQVFSRSRYPHGQLSRSWTPAYSGFRGGCRTDSAAPAG